VTARSRQNERRRKRRRFSSALRWQHPFKIENPNWHRERKAPTEECEWKRGESAEGKPGQQGEGKLEGAALPLVAITSMVARPKSKNKTVPQKVKLAKVGLPVGRGSPFVVICPSVAPPVGRRWAFVV